MQQEKKQMGVVGERDAVLAFKALGMRVIAVSTPEETTKALHRLYSEGIPVIFLTETCAQQVPLQDRPEVRRHPDSGQQRRKRLRAEPCQGQCRKGHRRGYSVQQ